MSYTETIRTDGKGRPIIELVWAPPACACCGGRSWKLHYAPEGGLLVQCDGCHTTERLRFEVSAEPADVSAPVSFETR